MRTLLLLALVTAAPAQVTDLSITWIGQSSFILKTDGGPTVVTDPPAASVGYTLPSVTADAVTITHNHSDHNNSAGLKGSFTLVDGRPTTTRQEMAAAGTTFVLIPGFHDNQNGTVRGPNTIIVWKQAGLKIVHMGDFGQDQLTAAQLADLKDLDILFIPAGGFFTITPQRAAAYVQQLNPRVAILMHYKTALGGPAQLAGLPDAGSSFSPVIYKPSAVTVNRVSLPLSTEVWVMQPASDAVAVSAATFAAGAPVAPGSIVSAFGTFTGSQTTGAAAYPLLRKLGDTEAFVDGKTVPLYYASPGQVNLQVPAGTAPGQSLLEVKVGGQSRGRGPLTVAPNAPGVFAVTNENGAVNSAAVPAHRGETLQIYGTGQGAVSPTPEDGAAAGSQPPSVASLPNVFLNGRQLVVAFSGLTPGLAGVWQINVTLPSDAPTGTAMPLVVVSGFTSNTLSVSVVQ